ncbi:retrotransposon ORF1 [Tanacetum coccineum]
MGTSSSTDKVELDGKIIKEEEEAVKRIKGEALKEKEDPGAFIFPIRLEGQVNENALADTGSDINTMPFLLYVQLGRDDMKKVDKVITMINHTQAEAMGILTNVLCQVGVTTLIAKFLILYIPIDRDLPIVVGRGFLCTIGAIVNTPERLFSTFDGFCHQTFRAARSDFMRNAESDSDGEEEYKIMRNKFGAPIYGPKLAPYYKLKLINWKPDYKGSYTKEEEATGQWRTEIRLTNPLWEQTMTRLDHHDPNAQDMKPWKRYCFHKFTTSSCYREDVAEMQSLEIDDMLRIRLRKAASDEEIFTSVAWIRAFNINEPIYVELCHEFYSTYEFDEVCADDELQTKKIIKFRLGGRAHRDLRNDDNFNAHDYWLSISREDYLGLSRSHTFTIRNPILWVIHKMITYGLCQRTTGYDKVQNNDLWLLSMFDARHQNGYANVAWVIARWMKRKGAETQKESQICCGQFISKLARKCRVLTEDVVRSLSAPIYCRDLDTTTLRDLIDFDGKLIPEDPQSGVPRVGIPRPPRASMQDLYDRMGRMEIRQEAIERMEYRQSYHWDRYQGVFEHMAGVYSVPMQGAYNPPGYAQPQYDQYYQQYPPPPPQYQQQQDDDE